jgi:hypothetical protein
MAGFKAKVEDEIFDLESPMKVEAKIKRSKRRDKKAQVKAFNIDELAVVKESMAENEEPASPQRKREMSDAKLIEKQKMGRNVHHGTTSKMPDITELIELDAPLSHKSKDSGRGWDDELPAVSAN